MKKYLQKKLNAESSSCTTLQTLAVCSSLEAIEHIGVGCFYELDHSKLPPEAPEQLKSVRVVMVSKKALFKVSVRFPSIHSLQAFLSENGALKKNQIPALDEKYLLEPETASELLYRRVSSEEISDWSKVWSFWAVIMRRRFESLIKMKTTPLKRERSEISLSGFLQGTRKRVRFLSPNGSPSPVPASSAEAEIVGGGGLSDEASEEEEEKEAGLNVVVVKKRRSERRKPQPIKTQNKPNRPKRQEQSNQIVVRNRSEKRMVKVSAARWSSGRFKLSEENMLKVLKTRGATAANPIKKPDEGLALVTTSTTTNSLETSMDWNQAYTSVTQLQDKYTQLAARKSKIKEQMQQVSQSLFGIEEQITVLKLTMEAPVTPLVCHSEAADIPELTDNERGVKENKATKLERLRSGFKICRPQGTFLWPNMNLSMSQHQINWSAVPITPSITSSTKPATPLDLVLTESPHGPDPGSSSGSLVKPFAERCPVNTSTLLRNVTNPPSLPTAFTRAPSEIEKSTSMSQNAKTLQINLNEIPGDAQQNESTADPRTLTYQRRRQLMKTRKENNADARKDNISSRGHSKAKQHHEYHQQRW